MPIQATRFLAAALTLLFAAAATAQATARQDFRIGFSQGLKFDDQKLMDKWMKKQDCAAHAALYFEELYVEVWGGNQDVRPKCEALQASWERCFEGSRALQKLQRWVDGMNMSSYEALQRGRNQAAKVWNNHLSMQNPSREELLYTMQNFIQLADTARSMGHMIEVAEQWSLAAVVGGKIKKTQLTLDDRREIVRAREEFLLAREAWEFTGDTYYNGSKAFVKDEKLRIADDEKKAGKRKEEGYSENTRGVEAYVMPDAKDDKHALSYAPLKDWTKDLDYGPKNGIVPQLWWNTSTNDVGTSNKIDWFQRRELYFTRTGGNKFAISLSPDTAEGAVEIDAGSRPKPSTFWLDSGKKVPYTMWFWIGSDRERVGLCECNLAMSKGFALAYYRSAASWKTKVGKQNLVFYDDNSNGNPCDADPWEKEFKVYTLGEHNDGTPAPLLDSMRVGKSKVRQPYSEFLALGGSWYHLRKTGAEEVALRPLNPEYFKTGKAKLVWSGPKSSAPKQLVVQGRGDFKTAFFDLAGGKEVELPAGEYNVIFGRIVNGKGARAQNATLYGGDSKPFVVEAGQTTELKMGAPFQVQWTRKGDINLTIDTLKVFVRESSGCYLTELQGAPVDADVLAAKSDDGKGAKPVGSLLPFTNGDMVNVAAKSHTNLSTQCALFPMPEGYRKGPLTLTIKLRAEGLKVGLVQKKHAIFGELEPLWQ